MNLSTASAQEIRQDDLDACRRMEDLVVQSSDGHYQQHPLWGTLDTEVADARYRLYQVERDGTCSASALVRIRKLGPLPLTVADIPGGPVFRDPADLKALLELISTGMKADGVVTLELTPYLDRRRETELADILHGAGFQAAADRILPVTLDVDLTPEPEGILRAFRKSYRPLIRRSQREQSLTVRTMSGDEDAQTFQQIYDAMTGKGATPRSAPFFRDLLRFIAADERRGFALMVSHEAQPLGGTIVLRHGDRAIYAFGATSGEQPALPKGSLLQYAAMCRARETGATVYDLNGFTMGTGTPGERTPVHHVNFWKSGLGGQPRPLMGAWMATFRPLSLRLVRAARSGLTRLRK